MSAVMGLSLTADRIGWVLVDVATGTLLDHDALDGTSGAETAGAAAIGAHAIATAAGHEVDCIRITWCEDATHDGLRLQSRLRRLALSPVEVVPLSRARTVRADDAGIPSDVTLAYGAATAADDHDEASAATVVDAPVRRDRRRLLTSALGAAAAVSLGAFLLGAADGPDVAPAATTVEQPAAVDPGWVAVPALPPNPAAVSARTVVAVPSPQPAATETFGYQPAPSVVTTPAAQAAPQPAAVVAEPQGQPHLRVTDQQVVPHLGAADPQTTPDLLGNQPQVIPDRGVADLPAASDPFAAGVPAISDPALTAPTALPPGTGTAQSETVPHAAEQAHIADPAAPHVAGPAASIGAPRTEMTDSVNLFTALP